MMLAALAAVMVFPVGVGYGGEVTDGALIYQSAARHRAVIRTLDLETGLQSTLYTTPDRRTVIERIRAGGGRVALSTSSRGVRIQAMDARGEHLEEVARSRNDGSGECGRAVRLLDMSSSGQLLYERAAVSCRTHRGRYTLLARSAGGRVRTLLSRPTAVAYFGTEPPYRQLAGNQLVTWGPRLVRVRDLATNRVRRFVPRDRLSEFNEPAVAPDGRVFLDEFRHTGRGRSPLQTIRLARPGGASEVVHRQPRVYGQPHICGDRAVLHTFNQRRSLRVSLLDPPVPVFEGVMDPNVQMSCDAGHFVLLTISGDPGERAIVYPLPQ